MAEGVYAPQADSRLLIDALLRSGLSPGGRVLDLCTGTGVVAIAAAEMGAPSVTAFDICPLAVHCARSNAELVGVDIDIRLGILTDALSNGPFDVVLCNPPYLPAVRTQTRKKCRASSVRQWPGTPARTDARSWDRYATGRRSCWPTGHHVGSPIGILRHRGVPDIVDIR